MTSYKHTNQSKKLYQHIQTAADAFKWGQFDISHRTVDQFGRGDIIFYPSSLGLVHQGVVTAILKSTPTKWQIFVDISGEDYIFQKKIRSYMLILQMR